MLEFEGINLSSSSLFVTNAIWNSEKQEAKCLELTFGWYYVAWQPAYWEIKFKFNLELVAIYLRSDWKDFALPLKPKLDQFCM